MAGVTLTQAWVHNAADLDDYVAGDWVSGTATPSAPVEVRTYASGRRREVRGKGNDKSIAVGLRMIDRDTADWLDAMTGHRVLYRDPGKRVAWGVYQSVALTEVGTLADGSMPLDASFTLLVVTGTAEV